MFIFIVFLPFLAFILLTFFSHFLGKFGSIFITLSFMFLSFILSIYFFFYILLVQEVIVFETNLNWFDIGFLKLNWKFILDPLCSIMFLVVTFISFLVHVYSVSYMSEDISLNRFLSFLSLFTFFMLILVSSTNFIQLFLGWEGVGLSSYLLINFWFTRVQANKSAIKAMLMNRVGDISLLLAISIIYFLFKNIEFSVIFNLIPLYSNIYLNFCNFNIHAISLIAFFIFLAAVGKSAQLGLHMWLPDAMEGPTPVSALIHAATMVTAGVFLIVRTSIFFEFSIYILEIMLILGALTALFASTTACFQNDLKKIIAYSTCSQLGYMIVACGLSRYDLSMFHLFNHAFFKAALFLSAGVIIHALNDEQDVRKMGGLINLLPFTYLVILLASLSLAGFPFLSGFYSKDLILELALVNTSFIGLFSYLMCLAAAFFTNVYSFRLIYLVFLNKPMGFRTIYNSLHETNLLMGLPLLILTFFSVFSGYFFKDIFVGFGSLYWLNSIYLFNFNENILTSEFLFFFFKLIPFILFFLSLIIITKLFFKINFFINLFFFYYLELFQKIYLFFNQKWLFDFLYNSFFVNLTLFFGYSIFYKKIDKGLLEIFGPTGLSYIVKFFGLIIQNFQTGYIFNYLFYILVIFVNLIMLQMFTLFFNFSIYQFFELTTVVGFFMLVTTNKALIIFDNKK